MDTYVTIKKGFVTFKFRKSDIVSFDQSPDGLCVVVKGTGAHNEGGKMAFTYDDQYMPYEVKEKIKSSLVFNSDLVVDLDNYRNPVEIKPIVV